LGKLARKRGTFFTTDYCTIEIFGPCERFLSGFDKNLLQASKIFFGRRNGEIILIPTYNSAPAYHCKLGKKEGEELREAPQQRPL
jgi:hypothetical protein